MNARLFQGLLALIAAGCAPEGPEAGGATDALEITAKTVEIGPGELNGLRLRGTRVLTAKHPAFGGFSGLIIVSDRLHAVTDAGWWLEAPLEQETDGLELGMGSFRPLRDTDGAIFDKAGGDAEGLAVQGDEVRIAFERDHRIMTLNAEARVVDPVQERAFETLGSNQGMEALATLPDGGLIAIAEAPDRRGHPVFVWRAGQLAEDRFVAEDPYYVTGADLGADGRLYVLLRHYSPVSGVRIRIDRFGLTEAGFPDGASRQVLGAFESGSGIDNMEGISVWTDADGQARLTLISDNNFNFVQRTLLMDFEMTD
ncbi:MAG: esterase-like activity of phytase family protein [Paracoccaceae bacterium]